MPLTKFKVQEYDQPVAPFNFPVAKTEAGDPEVKAEIPDFLPDVSSSENHQLRKAGPSGGFIPGDIDNRHKRPRLDLAVVAATAPPEVAPEVVDHLARLNSQPDRGSVDLAGVSRQPEHLRLELAQRIEQNAVRRCRLNTSG